VRKLLLAFVCVLVPATGWAQITLPYPDFSTPTILRAEVEANDETLASTALNRTGGTMTGALAGTSATFSSTLAVTGATTLNSTLAVTGATTMAALSSGAITAAGHVIASTGNTYDLGASGTRWDDLFVRTINASLNTTLSGTLTVTGAQTFVGNTDLRGTLADSTGNLTLGDSVDISNALTVTGTTTTNGALVAAGTSTNTSVAVNVGSTVNGVRWGSSTAGYTNTLGALDTSGLPFLCFWCYHGPTANTLRRASGTVGPAYVSVDTAGTLTYNTGSAGTIDTDFTPTTRLSVNISGDVTAGSRWVTPVGSVSAPSFIFSGDTDTGLYWGGTDTLAFTTGGVVKATIGATVSNSATTDAPMAARGGNNVVNLFIGDGSSTSGLTTNQWSGDIRFNGTAVAWGDLTYFPNGGDAGEPGHFRFSTTSTSVGASGTNATVAVGRLVLGQDGDSTNPAVYFGNDTNLGFYRLTTDTIRFALGSTTTVDFSPTGIALVTGSSFTMNGGEFQLDEAIRFTETTNTPPGLASGSAMAVYMRGDRFIIAYNDGGTPRYKYLDLTGTGVTWVHSTSPP